jgi:microcystin-dependent protein
MPSHNHSIQTKNNDDIGLWEIKATNATGGNGSHPTDNVGGNQPHNNMPPYLVVNMWKRTA